MIENPSKFHMSKIIFLKKIGKVAKIYCAIKSTQKLGYKYVNPLALKGRLSPEASKLLKPTFQRDMVKSENFSKVSLSLL